MGAEIQYKSPFNFVQVLILALGAAYLNVIVFFVSESAGGSMVFNGGLVDHVQFAQVLGFTLAPIMILGLLTFAVGSAKPGFCRIAQWLGAIVAVVSIINPILHATDAATGIALALMHLVVAAAWFVAVRRTNNNQPVPAYALR